MNCHRVNFLQEFSASAFISPSRLYFSLAPFFPHVPLFPVRAFFLPARALISYVLLSLNDLSKLTLTGSPLATCSPIHCLSFCLSVLSFRFFIHYRIPTLFVPLYERKRPFSCGNLCPSVRNVTLEINESFCLLFQIRFGST